MKHFDISDFRFDGSTKFHLNKFDTKIKDFYEDKYDYEQLLESLHKEIDELQSLMYAHGHYGLLVIFQAMDAAGKDGTMKAVFQNVHPLGLSFYSFKRPSEEELAHDFLWRCSKVLPERGKIMVFNRSYYEEVLVVKVHPEILLNTQNIPNEFTQDLDKVFEHRYTDIGHFEQYLHRNGIKVLKFFLNVSKEVQAERLIERIEDPTKNWKFQEGDVKEREHWNEYMEAYQTAISETATENAPWFIVPADDKKNMRLIVAKIIKETLEKFEMNYPEATEERHQELQKLIEVIKSQN